MWRTQQKVSTPFRKIPFPKPTPVETPLPLFLRATTPDVRRGPLTRTRLGSSTPVVPTSHGGTPDGRTGTERPRETPGPSGRAVHLRTADTPEGSTPPLVLSEGPEPAVLKWAKTAQGEEHGSHPATGVSTQDPEKGVDPKMFPLFGSALNTSVGNFQKERRVLTPTRTGPRRTRAECPSPPPRVRGW